MMTGSFLRSCKLTKSKNIMKTDNSKYFNEKYTEGYNQRNKEINLNCLILIESELYEVTPEQRLLFYSMRINKENWNNSLDYIRENCKCLNINTKCFNY